MGFILKLKKFEVRLTKKTLMQRELQKMVQAMLNQMNFSMIQSQSRMEQEQKDMDTLLGTLQEYIVDDQQDQNSSQDDNVVPKKKMKRRKDYSSTKVKTRNLLTNISCRRFKQSDFNKTRFVADIFSFPV